MHRKYALQMITITENEPAPVKMRAFVYFIHEDTQNPTAFKIGKTTLHPADRCEQLQTGNPRKLVIYRWIEVFAPEHSEIEDFLHLECADKKIRGEWFQLTHEEVDCACAIIMSTRTATTSSDYPKWTEDDLIAVQQARVVAGKYGGKYSPRTARRKKKEFWNRATAFSDD
jgi:hypothetical protein